VAARSRELEHSNHTPRPLRAGVGAAAPLVFHRGAHAPYATRWFGVTSLAGHARNFVASAIAAESIDSRDWMRPGNAEELLQHCTRVLGAEWRGRGPTLAEALGRPVWIDFVADTGDDHDVSQAVARMLFASYSVEEGGLTRVLPRGDVLLFGGDTAYPVATGEEIARRVVAPWNEVLREKAQDEDGRRVLLGIPGNHDWYDGLDGFARLFRRKPYGGTLDDSASQAQSGRSSDEPRSAPPRRRRVKRRTGIAARQLHLDEVGSVLAILASAWRGVRALVSGSKIGRPRRLALIGYDPVQEASYWALPLAPGLEMWGVDRQLGRLDYRQRQFFAERRRLASGGRILFVAPDPAIAFGEKHDPGARMLSACRLSFEQGRVFYLTGDMHHYERRAPSGTSLHVIAGGGGAFLHGTRISPSPSGPAGCAWPSASMSRRLVAQVPFKLMVGSAGFIVHLGFALIASFELSASARGTGPLVAVACLAAACLAVGLYANVGHNRAHPFAVAAVAVPFGGVLGLLPMALRLALPKIVPAIDWDLGVVFVYAFLGAFGLGLFLMLIAVLGLEHQQAFSVLSHPGFKHFVRLCVHPDGRVEAWAIGKDDPLGKADPVLVDRFDWK
jgi:hypothetical protein